MIENREENWLHSTTLELHSWFSDKSRSKAESTIIMTMALAATIVNSSKNEFEEAQEIARLGRILTKFVKLSHKDKEKSANQ